MTKITMQLDELSCPSCMQKIETAISKQPGVTAVKVLFNASKIKAEIDEQTDAQKLAQVVTDLGYTVQSIKEK